MDNEKVIPGEDPRIKAEQARLDCKFRMAEAACTEF